MGLRIRFINLFVFIMIFAVLLQEYQVQCRGGGRGGSKGTYKTRSGGGSSSSGSEGGEGGGEGKTRLYLAIIVGAVVLVIGVVGCLCKRNEC